MGLENVKTKTKGKAKNHVEKGKGRHDKDEVEAREETYGAFHLRTRSSDDWQKAPMVPGRSVCRWLAMCPVGIGRVPDSVTLGCTVPYCTP